MRVCSVSQGEKSGLQLETSLRADSSRTQLLCCSAKAIAIVLKGSERSSCISLISLRPWFSSRSPGGLVKADCKIASPELQVR